MTPQEKTSAKRISAVMRAARKRKDLTQVEVSKQLGISQSALSKIENSLLIPSAPQWFEFCQYAGISPDCLSTGYIDGLHPVALATGKLESGFRLPKAYSELRGSTARTMVPFLAYFQSCYGEQRLQEWLWDQNIDPDYFVDLDSSINLNFCLDMARQLSRQGHLKARDIPKLVRPVSDPATHGGISRRYDDAATALVRLKALIENARFYECNFKYALESETRNGLDLSVTPEKHLKDIPYYRNDPELGDFLCRFKQAYFERFAAYGERGKGATVEEVECHYKGAPQCTYQIRMAS
jgi:transcriptional regulator with XRE-family HTH domain